MINSVKEQTDFSVAINEHGNMWLVHDKPLAEPPEYAEFYADEKKICLICESGAMHEVDIKLEPEAYRRLSNINKILLVHMEDFKTVLSKRVITAIAHK